METMMRMPACCGVLSEEEMTYTTGGAMDSVGGVLTAVVVGVSAVNYLVGAVQARNWYNKNKGRGIFELIGKSMDDLINYSEKSVWHAFHGIFTAVELVALWPVTGIIMLA